MIQVQIVFIILQWCLMSTYTTPFIDFDPSYQGAKIVFNGREYTITTINRDIEPFSRKVYQYKLGVI